MATLKRKAAKPKALPDPSRVVKVGDGRGFVIAHGFVVTAAHCLPQLPPAHATSYTEERTYEKLLSRLNDRERSIWAECVFADPVADIAVLGSPDDQALSNEALDCEDLVLNVEPLQIDKARSGRGWVLSVDGRWIRTTIEAVDNVCGLLVIRPTKAGMSGSPILNNAGLNPRSHGTFRRSS